MFSLAVYAVASIAEKIYMINTFEQYTVHRINSQYFLTWKDHAVYLGLFEHQFKKNPVSDVKIRGVSNDGKSLTCSHCS